jgi:hypothetical protein
MRLAEQRPESTQNPTHIGLKKRPAGARTKLEKQ